MNGLNKALAIVFVMAAATACGTNNDPNGTNNGTNNGANNGANNGPTNGATNNGANNGGTNNGTTNGGTNNGTTNGGTNNGTTNGAPDVEVVDCATVTADATVSTGDNFFDPTATTVSAGQVVQWNHDGAVVHTVTSGRPGRADSGDLFDSGLFNPGDTFCVRFNNAATVEYYCTVHPTEMLAAVTVQ